MDKFKLIRARLVLAQKLLEESDALPGAEGYKVNEDGSVYHPRYEREALVVYLLLTCFDLLGQTRSHITFDKWLSSKDPAVLEERKAALDNSGIKAGEIIENTKLVYDCYNVLYGVTRAFYAGINELPSKARDHLLSSMRVSKLNPESLKAENKSTSYPALPIESENKKTTLKLDFLYSLRNSFTHKLSQVHFSSQPSMSNFASDYRSEAGEPVLGASWG